MIQYYLICACVCNIMKWSTKSDSCMFLLKLHVCPLAVFHMYGIWPRHHKLLLDRLSVSRCDFLDGNWIQLAWCHFSSVHAKSRRICMKRAKKKICCFKRQMSRAPGCLHFSLHRNGCAGTDTARRRLARLKLCPHERLVVELCCLRIM